MTDGVPDPQRKPFPPPRAAPVPRADPLFSPQRAALPPSPPLQPPMPGSYAARDEELAELLEEDELNGPSLPIVLLSAAFGTAAGVITFYVAYAVALLRVEAAVALAMLALCFTVGATGALLSAVTGARATLPTIGLSCAVIVAAFLMFGLCMVVGALAATLLIAVGG